MRHRDPDPLVRRRRRAPVVVATVTAVLATGLGWAPAASAIPSFRATGTTVTAAAAGRATTLPGVSVTGAAPGATLQVTLSTDVGTLALADTTGLTLAYGYTSYSGSTVSFTGSEADTDSDLASLTLTPAAGDAGSTAHVGVTAFPVVDGLVYSPSNQHYYQYVPSSGISWTDARAQAAALSYGGQAGYLATIPDNNVNDLLSNHVAGAQNVWFGAKATLGTGETSRTWAWVDGPRAGDIVSTCSNTGGSCDFTTATTAPGAYSHWNDGEPNNYGYDSETPDSGEWVAVTNWGGTLGAWNDLGPVNSIISGFLVEFGDQRVGTSTPFTATASASSSIAVYGPPGAPTGAGATLSGTSATVTWTAPGSDGGSAVTGYTVTASPGGATCTPNPATATSCTLTGLTGGTAYTFTVTAANDAGTGPPSGATDPLTPTGPAGAVTSLAATPGDGSAGLSFQPPADNGGSALTGYEYSLNGTTWLPLTTTGSDPVTATVTGLTNGTPYDVSVRATNDAGGGTAAGPVTVTPRTVPDAPSGVDASASGASATVTWTAPASDGGSAVTGYTVTAAPGGATCTPNPATATTCTVTGLTPGTAYTFTVTATNDAGTSSPSGASDPVTAFAAPGPPSNLAATPADGSAGLSFQPPGDNGGSALTGYEYSLDGTTWLPLTTSGSDPVTATVTGLTNGTAHDVSVRATNAAGGGTAAGPVSVTPRTTPGAPGSLAVTPGDSSAALSFQPPASDGGSAVTGYEYSLDGDTWLPLTTSGGDPVTATVTGLTNGTPYDIYVRATNVAGGGTAAGPVSVTPRTVPDAPTGADATTAGTTATVTWNAPVGDGGSPLTGYTVTASPGGATCTPNPATATTCTVTGLTPGTAYTFTVTATNAAGTSAPSAPSGPVTPLVAAGPPTNLLATAGDASAGLSFNPPADDGGSPVTGYQVTFDGGTSWTTLTTTGTEPVTATLTGLTNGQMYLFVIRAVTEFGPGASSTLASVTPRTTPGAPLDLTVTPGDTTAGLSFSPPTDDGGSPVTGYNVSLDGGISWAPLTTTGTGPLTATLTGLTNGTGYSVTVQAVNDAGVGTPAPSQDVTPRTTPGAPTGLQALPGPASAGLLFTAPSDDGGSPVTGYEFSVDGGSSWSPLVLWETNPSLGIVGGLADGTTYGFLVRARNAAGPGPAAGPVSVIPRTVSDAPTLTGLVTGNGQLSVTVVPPGNDGGAAVTGYTVTAQPGGATVTLAGAAGGAVTFTGLTNGTPYTLTAVATNAAGDSPVSAGVTGTPTAAVPLAPRVVLAITGGRIHYSQRVLYSGRATLAGVADPGAPVTITTHDATGATKVIARGTTRPDGSFSAYTTAVYNETLTAAVANGPSVGTARVGLPVRVAILYASARVSGRTVSVTGLSFPGYSGPASVGCALVTVGADGVFRKVLTTGVVDPAVAVVGRPYRANAFTLHVTLPAGSYRLAGAVATTPWNGPSYGPTLMVTLR